MRCHYPNCYSNALYIPVIALPTMTMDMTLANRPSLLLFKEVCQKHRDNYNLLDWVGENDWAYLQEQAQANGFVIPEAKVMLIQFKPMGWTPKQYMEVDSDGATSVN